MYPLEEDAYFATNSSFSITCHLNEDEEIENARGLYFEHKGSRRNLDIDDNWLTPINARSLKLTVPAENATSDISGTFICMMRTDEDGADKWVTQMEVNIRGIYRN